MTVNEQWKAYRKACYGDAVLPPIQELEVHKAFHAGLWIGFAMLDQITELPEYAGVVALTDLRREAQEAVEAYTDIRQLGGS